MACPMPLDCDWPEPISIIRFEGDPDIVFLGFVIPAVAASVLAFAGFVYMDSASAIQRRNDLDRLFIKTLRSDWLKGKTSPWLNDAIEDVAVLLTDQQLIVGTSILIVGLYQHCTITQYHFYLVYVLGFVSLSTVSLTLELGQDRYLSQSSMRHWRVAWIISMHVFVIVMSVVAADDLLMWIWGQPAQCIWYDVGQVWGRPTFTPVGIIALIINIVILVWQVKSVLRAVYGVELGWLGQLLHGAANLFHLPIYILIWNWQLIDWIDEKMSEELSTSRKVFYGMIFLMLHYIGVPIFALAILGFSIAELLKSHLLNYIRSMAVMFWGICQWAKVKSDAEANGLRSDESKWGFGQVMPVLLLVLPVATILEAFLNARALSQALKRNPGCRRLQSGSEQKQHLQVVCPHADCCSARQNSEKRHGLRTQKGVVGEMECCNTKTSIGPEKNARVSADARALEVTSSLMESGCLASTSAPAAKDMPTTHDFAESTLKGDVQGKMASEEDFEDMAVTYDKVLRKHLHSAAAEVDKRQKWLWQERIFQVWIIVFVSSCLGGILYAAFLGWVL